MNDGGAMIELALSVFMILLFIGGAVFVYYLGRGVWRFSKGISLALKKRKKEVAEE
jgi:hypothetical protein